VAGKKIYKYDNHYWKWELKLWQGLMDSARHIIGCHVTQETMD